MTSYKYIAIGGQFDVGKDTIAKLLNAKVENFITVALAEKVKLLFSQIFHVDLDFIEEWKRKPYPPPGFNEPIREGLIKIGDGFRKIKPNIWFEYLLEKYQNNNLIISDIRYKDDLRFFKEKNSCNILVYRPGKLNNYPNDSEQELVELIKYYQDKPTHIVTNNKLLDIWIKNDSIVQLDKDLENIIVPYIREKLHV